MIFYDKLMTFFLFAILFFSSFPFLISTYWFRVSTKTIPHFTGYLSQNLFFETLYL